MHSVAIPTVVLALTSLLTLSTLADSQETGDRSAGKWFDVVTEAIGNRVLMPNDFVDNPVVVLAGNENGLYYAKNLNNYDEKKIGGIASASKWVASATIMAFIEEYPQKLNLATKANQLLDFWTNDDTDERSITDLRHLLSFHSGFSGGAACAPDDYQSSYKNARCIYEKAFQDAPGTKLTYNGNHFMIALAMLEKALDGTEFSNFDDVFQHYLAKPLNFKEGTKFNGFGGNNVPRLDAGLIIASDDYAKFMLAIHTNTILSKSSTDQMELDHTLDYYNGADTSDSPFDVPFAATFHYGLGLWRECRFTTNWKPECSEKPLMSSIGIQGYYPFLDRTTGYWMLFARTTGTGALSSMLATIGIVPAMEEAFTACAADPDCQPVDRMDGSTPAPTPTVVVPPTAISAVPHTGFGPVSVLSAVTTLLILFL